jgi:hypothetical protein
MPSAIRIGLRTWHGQIDANKLACPRHLLLPVRLAAIDLGMPAQIGFGRAVDRLGRNGRRTVCRQPARRGDDGFLGHAGDIGRHQHALLAMLEHRLPFEFGAQRRVGNAAFAQPSREGIDAGGLGSLIPAVSSARAAISRISSPVTTDLAVNSRVIGSCMASNATSIRRSGVSSGFGTRRRRCGSVKPAATASACHAVGLASAVSTLSRRYSAVVLARNSIC